MRIPYVLLVATLSVISTPISMPIPAAFAAEQASAGADAHEPLLNAPVEETRPLSLADAIAYGLQNNLDVEVSRYEPYIAQMDAEGSWGAYDPFFSSQASHEESRPPSELKNAFVNDELTRRAGARIDTLLPYLGATLNVGFDAAQEESDTIVRAINPQLSSALSLGASVPLMKGLIWNEAWTAVKTNKLVHSSSLDVFTASLMDTVQQIITQYWELVATKEQTRVAEKSLESNQALLDQTRTQYEVGVVSRVEVVQAEAGVANSEFNLIVARNDYRNAQDNLIASVLGDRLRANTTLLINPTDNPEFTAVTTIDPVEAVATAFRNRPEFAAAQKTIEQTELQLRFAKNQRLPELNFEASYRTSGVAGTGQPGFTGDPPPDVGNSFGDTFGSYFDARDYTVKGVFSIPIPNTRARKNVAKAKLQERKSNSQLIRLKQSIIVTVRAAARSLLASAQGVEAAERRRLAAAEQLRAERIRLEHGESTPFDVLQRDRDLVEAESQKIEALKAFRLSEVALERAQGTILDDRNIQIDAVRELR